MEMQLPIPTAENDGDEIKLVADYGRLARFIEIGGTLPTSDELFNRIQSISTCAQASFKELLPIVKLDPVFSLRLLEHCQRAKSPDQRSIIYLHEALSRIGTQGLIELCGEFGEISSPKSTFYGRGVASVAYQSLILCGLIAQRIFKLLVPEAGDSERAFLLSSGSEIGLVLLTLFKPQYVSWCKLRSFSEESCSFNREVKRIYGQAIPELSARVVREAAFPPEFITLIETMHIAPWNRRAFAVNNDNNEHELMAAGYLARRLTDEIEEFYSKFRFARVAKELLDRADLPGTALATVLNGLAEEFGSAVQQLGLTPFNLPRYIKEYTETEVEVGAESVLRAEGLNDDQESLSKRLNPFLYELRACFKVQSRQESLHRLSQVICSTMLALVKALNFDRVVFFQYSSDTDVLTPRYFYGAEVPGSIALTRCVRDSGCEHMPVVQACIQKRAIFHGDPVIGEDWPFVAFPAIAAGVIFGVFYADKTFSDAHAGLTSNEQVSVMALAEEWHDISEDFICL